MSITDPADHVSWMNDVGIDHAVMNPGAYGFLVDWLGADRPEGIRRCNDFVAARLHDFNDRLMPTTLVDWSDLDNAVLELTRMRAEGSRSFWLQAKTFHGMSPAHPDWDRVWSAATDLGMVALIHVGNTPPAFEGGWGNVGWELPGGSGPQGFFRLANALRHQAAEMLLASMVFGGVFARHPNLTVILEELLVGWIPAFVTRCETLSMAGPWPYELTPAESVRRNIRATPLPGLGDFDPIPILEQLPGLLVFSSDHPHGEGSPDPIEIYEPALSALDPQLKASFLGDNVAECFARMGDPLTRSH